MSNQIQHIKTIQLKGLATSPVVRLTGYRSVSIAVYLGLTEGMTPVPQDLSAITLQFYAHITKAVNGTVADADYLITDDDGVAISLALSDTNKLYILPTTVLESANEFKFNFDDDGDPSVASGNVTLIIFGILE